MSAPENLLGLPLSQAEQRLSAMGKRVRAVRYESKRGLEGADDWRVLRCREVEDGQVELVVSAFLTRL